MEFDVLRYVQENAIAKMQREDDFSQVFLEAARVNNVPVIQELLQQGIYPKSNQFLILKLLIIQSYNKEVILTILKKCCDELTPKQHYQLLEGICYRRFVKEHSNDELFDYLFDKVKQTNFGWDVDINIKELREELPQIVLYHDGGNYMLKRFLEEGAQLKGIDVDLLITNKCINNMITLLEQGEFIEPEEKILRFIVEMRTADDTPAIFIVADIEEAKVIYPRMTFTHATFTNAIKKGSVEMLKALVPPMLDQPLLAHLKSLCATYPHRHIIEFLNHTYESFHLVIEEEKPPSEKTVNWSVFI